MKLDKFIAGQRRAINWFCAVFVGLVSLMWVATVVDKTFRMGWGWDSEIVWLAPPMVLFAFLLRFCAMAIFKFVEGIH